MNIYLYQIGQYQGSIIPLVIIPNH